MIARFPQLNVHDEIIARVKSMRSDTEIFVSMDNLLLTD